MTNLQSKPLIELNLDTREITITNNIKYIDIDKNIANIFLQIYREDNAGLKAYLTKEELDSFVGKMFLIKPVTNNFTEITGINTEEFVSDNGGGVLRFIIPTEYTNRNGIVKCEIHISKNDELLASDRFVYNVKQSLVTQFNNSLLEDSDFPVLQQLISEIQKASNIDDTRISETTTYSSYKIDSQIKEKANYTFIDVRQYGAKGNGITDDTQSIQDAIDYASTLTDNSTGGNVVIIKLPFGNYKISTIYLKRNIKLCGGGTLIITGTTGIVMDGCLYNILEDINIKLTKDSQTAISLQLDKDATTIKSQLNNFNNVIIEGNNFKDTVGIKIGYSWVNTFNGCKIFRCADGIWFNEYDSNSNIFYNCEIRHISSHENSKVAILHRDGKNNAFIGGVIENFHAAVDLRKGDFKLQNVYTEAFYIDTPFIMQGGTLSLDGCLLKGKFKITGGEMLRIVNCDGYHLGYTTNINSPLIQFFADVDTEVVMANNKFPDDVVFTREGYYKDGSSWTKKVNSKTLKINDRKSIISYVMNTTQTDITGDGTSSTVIFDEKLIDDYNEYDSTTGIFTPLNGGLYRINVSVQLYHVRESMYDNALFIIESHGKSYKVDSKHGSSHSGVATNELYLQGSLLLYLPAQQNIRINVKSTGGTKEVDVVGKNGESIFSYLNIERVC